MRKRDPEAGYPDSFTGLEIGLEGGDIRKRIEAVGDNNRVFLSVGAGPWVLDRDSFVSIDDEIEKLELDIITYGADAVGEFGFDNHWKYGSKGSQRELFEKEAALAKKHALPIVIHTRDADSDLLDSLSLIDDKTIMHCFSSGPDMVKILLDKGAYISFAGNVTYISNVLIQESAKIVPLDRILYETDSPYLAPIPKRGRMCYPEYTEYTLDFLAELKGIERELLKEKALENFHRLMGGEYSKVKRNVT